MLAGSFGKTVTAQMIARTINFAKKKNKRSPAGFPVSLLSKPVMFWGLNPYIVKLTGFVNRDCATMATIAGSTSTIGNAFFVFKNTSNQFWLALAGRVPAKRLDPGSVGYLCTDIC